MTKANRSERKKVIRSAIIVFAAFIAVWQIISTLTPLRDFVPSASSVISAFIRSFYIPIGKHTMPHHVAVSLFRVLVAFGIACFTGVILGVLMGYFRIAEAIIKPIFEFIRPIPPLAWIPMSILWFGIGNTSKFFIIFLGCFTFITVNTYVGTKSVDPVLIGAARMLGANERQVFLRVVLPSTVPYIFAGLHIAITAGWSAVVGAELIRSDDGVGWIVNMGMVTGNTVQVMVGMMAIGIVGFVLATAMAALERRLCKWNQQEGM
ncbi:MAG TPA: ABC transporter permease [Clostridiaceae bacterium]|nr:ABC transporter permease [Clostridiaceae bacterium]